MNHGWRGELSTLNRTLLFKLQFLIYQDIVLFKMGLFFFSSSPFRQCGTKLLAQSFLGQVRWSSSFRYKSKTLSEKEREGGRKMTVYINEADFRTK